MSAVTTSVNNTVVVIGNQSSIITNTNYTNYISDYNINNVVVNIPSKEVVLTGIMGPAGIEEPIMMYSKRTDFVGTDTIYKGEATPGSQEASSSWRISKLLISLDGDVSEKWAEGESLFNKIWLNRATYNYI